MKLDPLPLLSAIEEEVQQSRIRSLFDLIINPEGKIQSGVKHIQILFQQIS